MKFQSVTKYTTITVETYGVTPTAGEQQRVKTLIGDIESIFPEPLESLNFEYPEPDPDFESDHDIQEGFVQLLRKNNGSMQTRDIERVLNSHRFGLKQWVQAVADLKNAGIITETGKGIKGDPRITRLEIQ